MGSLPFCKDLYEWPTLHHRWEAIYRDDRLLNRTDDELLDRCLAIFSTKTGISFLDAGCGVGDHTIRLIKRGHGVWE